MLPEGGDSNLGSGELSQPSLRVTVFSSPNPFVYFGPTGQMVGSAWKRPSYGRPYLDLGDRDDWNQAW